MPKANAPRYVEFRVYAGPHNGQGLFVYARVYATKHEMLTTLRAEARAKHTREAFPDQVHGCMQTFTRQKVTRRRIITSGCIGRVSLYRGRLGTEVITHEFAHAMFSWAERKRLISHVHLMRNEELLCYALGRMTSRFVSRALRLGLYGDD